MKQEPIRRSAQAGNATFQQKSAGVSLFITGSAALYYVVNAWAMRPAASASGGLPDGYGTLVLITLILMITAQIVLQSVLAIGHGSTPAATSGDELAAMKGTRNAYWVLAAGMLAVVGSVLLNVATPLAMVNLAILSLVLAEVVQFASQIIYARPGQISG